MKTFKLEITEILSKQVYVKADNRAEAIEKAKHLYETEKIVLDSGNFIDKEIKVVNYE